MNYIPVCFASLYTLVYFTSPDLPEKEEEQGEESDLKGLALFCVGFRRDPDVMVGHGSH